MEQSPFISLSIITLLAVIVPFVVTNKFIRIPIVVGEIIAGIIIGKSGLNLIHDSHTLKFISEFGFVYLMFLSGLEFNFKSLLSTPASTDTSSRFLRPVYLVSFGFILTLLLGLAFGFTFKAFELVRNPYLMGLILTTTALGIVIPVIKEHGLMKTIYGQTVILCALVSDFVSLLILSILIASITQGVSFKLFLFLIFIIPFFLFTKLLPVINNSQKFKTIIDKLAHATAQIRVRAAIALMVFFVVLAEFIGIEVILGAFLAGSIIGMNSDENNGTPLYLKLDAIGYGFFIPVFFIHVGAQFDLPALTSSKSALTLVPLLIIAAYLVKILSALIFKCIFSWRETIAMGFLMSTRLSLVVATSTIALSIGAITSATNSAVILVVIITCMVSPLLFTKILSSNCR